MGSDHRQPHLWRVKSKRRSSAWALRGLISARASSVSGIVNGIDTDVWDPETDETIAKRYTCTRLRNRAPNREVLCERFGFVNDDAPIFTVVSRLTWQKGMDILVEVVDDLIAMGGKLAVLGSGEEYCENAFLEAARRHPGKARYHYRL